MLVFSKVYVTSLNSMQVVYSFFGVYSLSTYLQDNNFFSSLKLQTTTTIINFWRQMWPTRWYICILLSLNKMTNQHSLHSTKQNTNYCITVYFFLNFQYLFSKILVLSKSGIQIQILKIAKFFQWELQWKHHKDRQVQICCIYQ